MTQMMMYVAWYILGNPTATDPRVQKILELFKQSLNRRFKGVKRGIFTATK